MNDTITYLKNVIKEKDDVIAELRAQITSLSNELLELKCSSDTSMNNSTYTPRSKYNTVYIPKAEIVPYTYAHQKFSSSNISERQKDFVDWEKTGDRYNLVLKLRTVGYVDYLPRCNYVNKGYNGPAIVNANAPCCTVVFGDAYLQFRAPDKGVVYYKENLNLQAGDTILYIECNQEALYEFEKQLHKDKLLEKKRMRELEKQAMQELVDDGEIFPEASKRPPIPKDVVDSVWNRDAGKCVYCGSAENLHLDHIIPFSKGGDTSVENLQLLCQKCNLEKSNKIG